MNIKSKKVRILIYSLVAWFVGMAVIMYDFAVGYAASFNDGVEDAEWHFYTDEGKASDLFEIGDYDKAVPVSDSNYYKSKYTEHFTFAWASSDKNSNVIYCDMNFGSDSEIVLAYENSVCVDSLNFFQYTTSSAGRPSLFVISKTKLYGAHHEFNSGTSHVSQDNYNVAAGFTRGYSYQAFFAYNYSKNMNYEYRALFSGKVKVFDTVKDATNYLETGIVSNLSWQGASPQYDGDNIYLNDFQMIVHDSNAYSAYYLEFKYTIPEQLRDAASLQLQIEEQYDWTITGLSSLVAYPRTFSGNDYIDLLQYPTGFKLYLDDINVISQSITDIPIASTVSRRAVIGSELAFDTSGISIGGLGGETIVKVTNSKLYLTCYVIANNKFGVNYTGSVDFVSGFNDMSSFTPDPSGNYKYNGDLKNQGHYYTDVATDAAGNVTYNYYYYGDDNSKTEISAKDSADNTLTVVPVPGQNGSIINNITMPDHIFVNVSGSSGGGSSGGPGNDVGNVTIEDDDLSFNSLRDSIKDGYGLIDDTDTGAKGDGLIAMLSDLFGYLPAKFVGLIMLGTSSVVGIAVLRMIFKR